ncbi:hypothetical protein HBH98_036540 [Parastagonospora nodorum]|nr:hypothetical protein HBH53_010120 [Parastagonospora nodorum]KAH3986484.1 hypothetical protein HBH52_041320 [Parastagonospora nodorum]KAH3988372.1 hypothetical protein HBH51_007700 [Parastagonospora nodorum]KAH4040099.1 hypothetical protein HBI09_023670 [Parastagonospora nodorum]KAH4056585.1 hypothetical protein HBH49_055430 [Parastagonospora nodorum]
MLRLPDRNFVGQLLRLPTCDMMSSIRGQAGHCSEVCRAKNLYQHKIHCKGLLQKLVDSLGEILQEIFYVHGSQSLLYPATSPCRPQYHAARNHSENFRVSGQALFAFPAGMLPDLSDRHAVLGVGRSEHALAYLHDFIAQMLTGRDLVAWNAR